MLRPIFSQLSYIINSLVILSISALVGSGRCFSKQLFKLPHKSIPLHYIVEHIAQVRHSAPIPHTRQDFRPTTSATAPEYIFAHLKFVIFICRIDMLQYNRFQVLPAKSQYPRNKPPHKFLSFSSSFRFYIFIGKPRHLLPLPVLLVNAVSRL